MSEKEIILDLIFPIASPIIIMFLKWVLFDILFYKCPLKIIDERIYNISKEPLTICSVKDFIGKRVCLLRNINELIFHGVILTQNDSVFLNHEFKDDYIVVVEYIHKNKKRKKTIKFKTSFSKQT